METYDKNSDQAIKAHKVSLVGQFESERTNKTHKTSSSYDHFENSWLWKAIHLLLPGQCLLCHATAKHSLCEACLNNLPALNSHCYRCAIPLPHINRQPLLTECGACQTHPPGFDKSVSAFTYSFPLDRLIHAFKNSGNLRLGKLLNLFLLEKLKDRLTENKNEELRAKLPEYITYVAMHRSKKLKRKFNQSEFIAKELGIALKIPIINMFKKIKPSADQHSLNRKERIHNLKGCFILHSNIGRLVDKNNKPIKHIAIVDDVMTTGATANELSKLLKEYGVEKVEIWILARTPKPNF